MIVERRTRQPTHRVQRRQPRILRRLLALPHPGVHRLQHRRKQPLLAAEMVVDHRLRRARPLDDLAHPRPAVAPRRKHRLPRRQELRPRPLGIAWHPRRAGFARLSHGAWPSRYRVVYLPDGKTHAAPRKTASTGKGTPWTCPQTRCTAANRRKAAASGWIGSALEYYDFFIYATAASLVFPQIFFPSANPTTAIVASLATYGVGYVARPIGAFVLGHIGDTRGRKHILLLCMFLMGVSTMAVGLLPTYNQVGILAPVLLVILRLIQGFAVAGEISGASSMILEHAPFGRRGFFASFTLQGVQAGQILAAAVFLPLARFMPEDTRSSAGAGASPSCSASSSSSPATSSAAKWTRRPAFAEEASTGSIPRSPIAQAFALSGADMARVVCMALMNTVPVVATVFGAAYAVQAAYGIGFQKDVYLWIPVLGNIVAVLVIPFVGNLSDRIGRRLPIAVGAVGSGLLSFVYLYAISIHSVPLAIADVPADVGRRLPGLQRGLPELLPRAVPDPDPRLRHGHLPERRHHHHRPAARPLRRRRPARLHQHPPRRRRHLLRRHHHRRRSPPSAPARPTASASTNWATPAPCPSPKPNTTPSASRAYNRLTSTCTASWSGLTRPSTQFHSHRP